ncbi:fungal-specific transcription factor domain-containing protein [Penicillium coprophilum]|uniref:fungal-specific transcription factor domain-containing protein n=1 Tax=Penicillium coprophilum TaxID=36646 RepID=UPI0023913DCE|nr:fungal-specific transcription factor domain-containing protein [Penicillium coprophilum]KAJ5162550.1 fungal-specific transcription factor domain-containing protein [Penicillium coprophilum]
MGRLDISAQAVGELSFCNSLPLTVPLEPYMTTNPSRGPQMLDMDEDIPPELVDHLLDLYFQWEQPWNQVVDETLFRKSQGDNGRFFSTLLLNCILAIGSRYSERIDLRTDPNDPNTAGQLFLDSAEVMLHFDLRSPSIVTVQSLSVMAMAYVVSNIPQSSLLIPLIMPSC